MRKTNLEIKISLFKYILLRLVGLDFRKSFVNKQYYNLLLSEITMTKAMKRLYFLCLLDAKFGDGKLFEVFDDFRAYLRGPVEESIYLNRHDNRGISPLIYKDENYSIIDHMNGDSRLLKDITEELSDNLLIAADKAIFLLRGSTLKESGDKIMDLDDTRLVDLSRSLSHKVWADCFYYSEFGGEISRKLKEPGILEEEIRCFINKVKI